MRLAGVANHYQVDRAQRHQDPDCGSIQESPFSGESLRGPRTPSTALQIHAPRHSPCAPHTVTTSGKETGWVQRGWGPPYWGLRPGQELGSPAGLQCLETPSPLS